MGEAGKNGSLPDAPGGPAARRLAARLALSARKLLGLGAEESGATAVEYGLIVGLIFLAIIGGLSLFATNENTMYTHISNAVSGATH
jgi:pilus assembly protein Flp/PilA